MAAIDRLSPAGSEYRRAAAEAVEDNHAGSACRELAGVLKALRLAYENGYLRTLEELVAADLFGDFLDMASHLLEAGYKDPAAVLVGSVLEEHLRKLTIKAGGSITNPDGRPLKADTLNAELVRAGAYRSLDQKNVTAWLGLRNHAAHGEFDAYDGAQVHLMLEAVRVFISQHP